MGDCCFSKMREIILGDTHVYISHEGPYLVLGPADSLIEIG